ncbi:MAG TPA: hypothetical protein VFB01_11280 [Burkholderiales bacterium]|nr:hypothetical protein [Burkholderiales bacterium]
MKQKDIRSIARYFALVCAGTVLAGCGGPAYVKMTPETGAELKAAPVINVVWFRTVGMNIMTPKSQAGGGLLPALIVSGTKSGELPSGDQLVKAYGLPDQADEVSAKLVEKLKTEGRLPTVRVASALFPPRVYQENPAQYGSKFSSGLVLEINVEGPGAGYGAMNWQTYTYGFAGKARLIRPSDGKILWSDLCFLGIFGDEADKRKLDVTEFEKDGGKRFKEIYHYSNDRCSRILADKLLGKAS